jgi:hypothetical protein
VRGVGGIRRYGSQDDKARFVTATCDDVGLRMTRFVRLRLSALGGRRCSGYGGVLEWDSLRGKECSIVVGFGGDPEGVR